MTKNISDWINFLESQHAHLTDNTVQHLTNEHTESIATTHNNIITPLLQHGFISVSGDDAQDFLQNQFCNDVRLVTGENSQLNGYCTAKGRLLALFRLFTTNNESNPSYHLVLPIERVDSIIKRLQMFVLMSQVTLEDTSSQLVGLGISGPGVEAALEKLFPKLPAETNASCEHESTSITRVVGDVPRFEIYTSIDNAQNIWQSVTPEFTPVGSKIWSWLDIMAGIPTILNNTAEAFVPQMVNLQSINALSFNKGCYPGQEVVARMHYLGKQKRRMYCAHVNSDTQPQAGDSLYVDGDDTIQAAGKVVSAAQSPGGGYDFLAVLQISSADKGNLKFSNPDGEAINLKDLPYSVELEGE